MVDSRNKPFTEPVLQAVAACLSRHARGRDSVVVGYSGGLDSTVLLHAAGCLAKGAALELSALHVHHGLNPNADAWAESCAQVCQALNIPLAILRVAVPPGTGEGVEAAARRVRHKALADHSAKWILLAHHADDQAETILHNLLRGAGVRGAAAMPESRGRVLRPLLGLARDELLAYAHAHRLVWSEDDSNADLRYTRNFLRHEVLPLIASRFPKASEQLAAAAGRFGEADSLLDDLASSDLGGNRPVFPLPLSLFRDLPDARARNLLRAMLTWHEVQPPDERRLTEFVRQLQTAGNDRHPRIDLARYSLWCEAGRLHFKASD
ncbi:MAG: tRNA lysidine(34) synthetase TilS [Rhodocyclales bacterium]|nr:tRNA lysidine(34) synthetase TilS [Rhodocyclales bacterium]